jgi:carbon catabolite-derepressing protein kinase
MEVMHEIYKTLQQLGMQWKRKPEFVDEHGKPVPQTSQRDKRAKDKQNEINQGLYFVETRCKIDDVVVSCRNSGRVQFCLLHLDSR